MTQKVSASNQDLQKKKLLLLAGLYAVAKRRNAMIEQAMHANNNPLSA